VLASVARNYDDDPAEVSGEPGDWAVFDIDGVLADVRHRLHHLRRTPTDWRGFFSAADADPPLPEGVALLRRQSRHHPVAYVTGRPEFLRRVTRTWLAGTDQRRVRTTSSLASIRR